MALYIVEEKCIACGDCEPECPTDSILEKPPTFIIKAETCTECEDIYDSPMCVQVCPIKGCILPLEAA